MPTVKINQSIKNTGGHNFFSPLTPAVLAHIQQIWSSCKSMQFLHCKYLRRQTRAFLLQHTKKVICVMLLHCMGKLLPPIFYPLWNALKQGKKLIFFGLNFMRWNLSHLLLLLPWLRRRHRWPRTHWRSYEHSWVSLKYRDGNATSDGWTFSKATIVASSCSFTRLRLNTRKHIHYHTTAEKKVYNHCLFSQTYINSYKRNFKRKLMAGFLLLPTKSRVEISKMIFDICDKIKIPLKCQNLIVNLQSDFSS